MKIYEKLNIFLANLQISHTEEVYLNDYTQTFYATLFDGCINNSIY